MVYFKMQSVNPLCHVPSVQIARHARQTPCTLEKQGKESLIQGSCPGDDNTSIMIPAVERGLSWTELPRLPGQTGGTGTISGAVPLIHGVTGVTTCTASPATVTLLRVLGQPCHPCPLLLTSERAKWGLQMGRGDSLAAKIILGFRQHHTPSQAVMRSLAQHHLVVLESESSSMSPPLKQIHNRQKKAQNTLVQAW